MPFNRSSVHRHSQFRFTVSNYVRTSSYFVFKIRTFVYRVLFSVSVDFNQIIFIPVDLYRYTLSKTGLLLGRVGVGSLFTRQSPSPKVFCFWGGLGWGCSSPGNLPLQKLRRLGWGRSSTIQPNSKEINCFELFQGAIYATQSRGSFERSRLIKIFVPLRFFEPPEKTTGVN